MSVPSLPQFQAAQVQSAGAALVHALCGAQYGDLEFDVGKSIRWTQWFVDDMHITDVNLGSQRYWVVNWTLTFPKAFHSVTGINFFYNTVNFRKEQWRLARLEQGIQFDPEDWVLFLDAHEGMALDTRNPQPPNFDVEPFKSYLYREIDRAEAASKDRVVLPFYAFVKHANVTTVYYDSPAFADGSMGFTTATASMGTPYYVPYQGMTRLIKVKVLDDPAFNWSTIDQPSAPATGLNMAIVSYGYAHWNLQDIVPPATTVEPLNAANDDGWRMRQLISAVRPITGLPYVDPWKDPAQDTGALPGPWAATDQFTPDPIVDSGPYLDTGVGWLSTPDTPDLAITGNVRWTARVRRASMPVPPATTFRFLAQHMGSQAGYSWIERNDTSGTMQIRVDSKVAALQLSRAYWSAAQTAQASPLDVDDWIGVELIATPSGGGGQGTWYGLNSADGTAWTRLGTPQVENRPYIPHDPDGPLLYVGGTTPTTKWPGRIYWQQLQAINRAQLVFPGTGGNYLSIPHDAVTQQIPADSEFVARVTAPPAGWPNSTVIAKNGGWYIWMGATNISTGFTIGGGLGSTFPGSAAHGFTPGTIYWIKVVRNAVTGAVSFYTAPDQVAEPTSWTKLGSDVMGAAGAAAYPAQVITVGVYSVFASPWRGRVLRAICRNGVGATTPQLVMPGLVGNYLSVTNIWSGSHTAIEVLARVSSNWADTITDYQAIVSAPGTFGFRRQAPNWWNWYTYADDNTPVTVAGQQPAGLTNGQTIWIRATANATTQTLEWALDSETIPTVWTEARPPGTRTSPGIHTYNGVVAMGQESGSRVYNGRLRRAIVRDGIAGTAVLDVNESNATAVGQTSFPATTGGTVTVNQRPPLAFTFPGIVGNYMTLPDAAPLNITGDIEIVARIAPSDWTPAAYCTIVTKDVENAPNNTVRSWILRLATNGTLDFRISTDGTTQVSGASAVLTGAVDGMARWIKVTRVASTGLMSFYWAADQLTEPTTWTAVGTATPGTGNLVNGAQRVMIGARNSNGGNEPFAGRISRVIVRNGIAGTAVLDVNETNATVGATTFTATLGATVTVTQPNGTICSLDSVTPWWGPIIRGPYFDLNENDAGVMATATTFVAGTGQTVTVTNSNKFVFPGVAGNYMTMPDAAPLRVTGDIEIVARVTATDWSPTGLTPCIASRFLTTGDQRSWMFRLAASGALQFEVSTDGINYFAAQADAVVPFTDGAFGWVKATRVASTGTVQFFTAPDNATTLEPTTWTKLGSDRSTTTGNLFAGTSALMFGSWDSNNPSNPWAGRISRVILRNGIGGTIVADLAEHQSTFYPSTTVSAVGGSVTAVQTAGNTIIQLDGTMPVVTPQPDSIIWRFDVKDYPGTGLSYTDPRGRVWTMSAANAIVANTHDKLPQPVTPDPSLAGLLVPLYDNVLRINMRDGVWYEGGELGNIPLAWDDATQTWYPRNMSPPEWHNTEEWVAPVG